MSEAELWREIKRLQATIDAMQSAERPLVTDFFRGIDLTRAGSFNVASGASTSFATVNFRGLILVSETVNYGGFALFAFDGGNSVEVADTLAMYSPTVGTANSVNVYIAAGVPTVQNNKALTVVLMMQPIRSS